MSHSFPLSQSSFNQDRWRPTVTVTGKSDPVYCTRAASEMDAGVKDAPDRVKQPTLASDRRVVPRVGTESGRRCLVLRPPVIAIAHRSGHARYAQRVQSGGCFRFVVEESNSMCSKSVKRNQEVPNVTNQQVLEHWRRKIGWVIHIWRLPFRLPVDETSRQAG